MNSGIQKKIKVNKLFKKVWQRRPPCPSHLGNTQFSFAIFANNQCSSWRRVQFSISYESSVWTGIKPDTCARSLLFILRILIWRWNPLVDCMVEFISLSAFLYLKKNENLRVLFIWIWLALCFSLNDQD